ncbi:MAG: biotin--[acetyl-CoA-carboxylase] ligase [Rhodospirillaceae bacterium]|nr:biotin--[acetyl-CoA-carboxylase] ligase [Rhodospirillaceae bacterium]
MTMAASEPELPSSYQLLRLGGVDSTNLEARRQAESGASDKTVIWATSQSAGRGRRGRSWVSPEGNIYFSILLRLNGDVADAMQLGFVIANAIAESLSDFLPSGTKVETKWPNDVLLNGKKISGILMESESANDGKTLKWLIIGVGINVCAHPGTGEGGIITTALIDEGFDFQPTSIAYILGDIVHKFDRGLTAWQKGGFAPVRNAWLARAAGLGGEITVRLPNETISGTFKDLNEDGALVLGINNSVERLITAGDVFISPTNGEMD